MSRPAQATREARAGMAVALATLAMAAASGVQAVAYLSSFGTTDRTDAFFAAFALYTVFGVFCQSIRVTSVPLLVGPDRALRGREYAATLALIAVPVAVVCFALAEPVAGLLAPGVSPAARETTESALRILGPAMILQLAAAGQATLLGIWDRFDIVAQGYVAGAAAGVVSYFVAVGPAGELALGWSMLSMAVVTAGWMTAGLGRAWTQRRPGRLPGPKRLSRDAGRILGRTLVYFVINGLFLITLAYVSDSSAGDATVLSYSYLFVSYLVAGTGVAVGISRVPDMTRGAKSDWDEVVADTVPHGFRYAVMVSAPAVAALVAAGAPLVNELVPAGLPTESAATLALFAALLAPWLAGALVVNFLLPALFALGRERLVNGLAVPLVMLHVAVTAAGDALWGAEGAVAAMCVAPIVFGSVLLAVGAGSRRRTAALQILRDAVTFMGLAGAAFGAAWLAGSVLGPGVARQLIVIAIGSALYLLALLAVAPRQIEVFLGAIGFRASRPGPTEGPPEPVRPAWREWVKGYRPGAMAAALKRRRWAPILIARRLLADRGEREKPSPSFLAGRRVRSLVLMPAGPGSLDALCDTADSLFASDDGESQVLVIDDWGEDTRAAVLRRRLPSADVIRTPSPSGGPPALWPMFQRAILFALDNYEFDLLVKLDTDAIITGPGFSSTLARRIHRAPGAGIAGSYRVRADGRAEDHHYHAAILQRERRWNEQLDEAARRAEARGWRTGDAVQAGVLALTREACEGMRDDGWLDWNRPWYSQLAEDLLLTIFTVACGYDPVSIGGPGGIVAVANKGLPLPTQQIIDGPWVAAHSVNHGYHGEREAELRERFREARGGWLASIPAPRAGGGVGAR
jgi:peptidoglycan biosynthesis protein MviN/MurJ (putative lipid II flippase)